MVVVSLILFCLGLLFIVKGGDLFVEEATWMSEITGIPRFVIGATIVSIATTLPELFVSIIATSRGAVDLGLNNVLGSVACNMALILGLSILIKPTIAPRRQLWDKCLLLVFSLLLLMFAGRDMHLTLGESSALAIILCLYFFMALKESKLYTGKSSTRRQKNNRESVLPHIIKFVFGLIGNVMGANLLVEHGTQLARLFGVSEGLIGLTLVALGTSLPELTTALVALKKGEGSLSMGNILGANILNITMILPLCSFISKGHLEVMGSMSSLFIPILLAMIFTILAPTLFTRKMGRLQGLGLIALYVFFLYMAL